MQAEKRSNATQSPRRWLLRLVAPDELTAWQWQYDAARRVPRRLLLTIPLLMPALFVFALMLIADSTITAATLPWHRRLIDIARRDARTLEFYVVAFWPFAVSWFIVVFWFLRERNRVRCRHLIPTPSRPDAAPMSALHRSRLILSAGLLPILLLHLFALLFAKVFEIRWYTDHWIIIPILLFSLYTAATATPVLIVIHFAARNHARAAIHSILLFVIPCFLIGPGVVYADRLTAAPWPIAQLGFAFAIWTAIWLWSRRRTQFHIERWIERQSSV